MKSKKPTETNGSEEMSNTIGIVCGEFHRTEVEQMLVFATESAQEEEIETLTAQMNTKLEDLGLPTGLTVAAVAGIAITGVALFSYKILNRS